MADLRPTSLPQFRSFSGTHAFSQENDSRPVHLGIGNYDGFHCGHRAVFKKARICAKRDGGRVGALTFSPHPEFFFRGENAVKLIFGRERKDSLFGDAGLDFAIHEPFSQAFADICAEDFVCILKQKIPALSGLYVGDNFRFGAKRRGDVEMLKKLGTAEGVSINIVDPVNYRGERISSTRIRAALASGEIADANAMLSAPYESAGVVISGNRLGRTIGFPTLNLAWDPQLRPRFGVYVVSVDVPATGQSFNGIANYGVRPTLVRFQTPTPLLETHLLNVPAGMPPPTYGDTIRVRWLHFLRPEKQFQDFENLKTQLERDKKAALEYCEGMRD